MDETLSQQQLEAEDDARERRGAAHRESFLREAELDRVCKRCHRTAREARTAVLGDVCGDCFDDLRQEAIADEMQAKHEAAR